MRFDVDIEMEQGIYNTAESRLWVRFQKLFHAEIFDRYQELRTNGTFTVENFMKYYYDMQISKIAEMDYNNNFYNKYLKDSIRRSYLFMMHGNQYEHMKRWIDQRLYFLDTYFKYGSEYESQATVRVEFAKYATEPVTFKIQTFKPAYVNIVFRNEGTDDSSTSDLRKKVSRGQIVEFSDYVTTNTDQEIRIFNARNLKSIGDVSHYTPKTAIIDQAVKLTELIVGTEENPNPNLQTLALGNNTYLTKIIAENCTSLSSTLDVSGCTNLNTLSLKGSTVRSAVLPDGGALQTIYLPKYTANISMKNLTVLDTVVVEGTSNITSLDIENCPKYTGYIDEDGNIVEGTMWNTLLSSYKPTDPETELSFKAYGYVNNYAFLDAAAQLANRAPENFNISGEVRYTGAAIPEYYSLYKGAFPNLLVRYPNVNNVSYMFQNYKNINSVWKRVEIKGTDDEKYEETVYYWNKTRGGEFPPEAYVTYEGVEGRLLDYYDDNDMKDLADEIKERLAPFSKFTNVNNMFDGMRVFEYLHDDTFDHIDMSSASTTYWFNNCNTLKWFEVPGGTWTGVRTLGQYAFANCYRALIYVPESTSSIHETSFYINNTSMGCHPVVLFESNLSRDGTAGLRDYRYGIDKNSETGHAKQWKTMDLYDRTTKEYTSVNVEYFKPKRESGIYINDIYTNNKAPIKMKSLNLLDADPYENPMGVLEFLPGALHNFTELDELATPTYGICASDKENSSYKTQEYDTSIARMFNRDIIDDRDRKNINFTNLFLVKTSNRSPYVTRYFLKSTSPKNVYVDKEFTKIEERAFDSCSASNVYLQTETDGSDMSSLTYIGDYAFTAAKLNRIYIPNSVTDMGEGVFQQCQDFNHLHFSEGMKYVPISCFRYALNSSSSAICSNTSISGFSPEITEIGDYAFQEAINLMLFESKNDSDNLNPETTTDYDCYFCGGKSTDSDGYTVYKNINYFTKLKSIGKYAFKNIVNISRLDFDDTINYIGASAFQPKDSKTAQTLILWDQAGDYSNLTIEAAAFLGRTISWKYGKDIFTETCYIPGSVKRVETNAFSPYINPEETGGAKLDFVLTERLESDAGAWAESFVSNCLRIIWNFKKPVKHADAQYGANMLYYLKNDHTALIVKLLMNATYIYLEEYIEDEEEKYYLTEILDEAFIESDDNLNVIAFDNKSIINRIGNRVFDTTSIYNIYVTKENSLEPSDLTIPNTLVVTESNPNPIGTGNPFIKTTWYDLLGRDDFIYLNEYCIGFSKNEETLTSTTKKIKEGTKFIYENAFSESTSSTSELITIDLPSTLTRICSGAFSYCRGLESINFKQCRDMLRQIDNEAFLNCYKLSKLYFTKAIEHIGFDAFKGCTQLSEIQFEDGIVLDSNSYPLTPEITSGTSYNSNITKIILPESIGYFFDKSSGTSGYAAFKKLNNITDLTVGGTMYENEDDYTIVLTEYDEDGNYLIDFSKNYATKSGKIINPMELYPHALYAGNPIGSLDTARVKTSKKYFILPKTSYNSSIDLTTLASDFYDDGDILRIFLGFGNKSTNTIYVKQLAHGRFTKTIFSQIVAQRVQITPVKEE